METRRLREHLARAVDVLTEQPCNTPERAYYVSGALASIVAALARDGGYLDLLQRLDADEEAERERFNRVVEAARPDPAGEPARERLRRLEGWRVNHV